MYTEEFKKAEKVRLEALVRRSIELKDEFSFSIALTKFKELGFNVELLYKNTGCDMCKVACGNAWCHTIVN